MKAAIFHQPGQPHSFEEVDIDQPQGREVLVRTAACGVCHSDASVAEGKVPVPTPMILGHEPAGIVEAVGADVTELKPGDHVIARLGLYCGRCPHCLSGHPNRCNNRAAMQRRPGQRPRMLYRGNQITGVTGDGAGFAEKMLTHEHGFVKIPDDVPLEAAALVGCAVVTGVGAVLNTAKVEPGATVAVFGAGGIGLSAIQGARLAGARRIIAVDVNESKLAAARRFGATHTVDASSGDPVEAIRKLSGGDGVDYAFEAIGLKQTAEQCIASLTVGGVATIIGMMGAGQKIEIDAMSLMAEKRVQGCLMGSVRFPIDAPRYIEFYRQGRLLLDEMVTRRIRLEQLDDAFAAINRGEVLRSVIMFQ
jgi:S-(hydroxymethyl)glutathione dehydrogenase/alcohol dehydrogenase